jgi:HK97 family phage major capsid protein
MIKLHELRETRAAKVAEMAKLVADAETAGRDLQEAEAKRFGDLKGEVRALDERIGRAEAVAEMERTADAEPVGGREMQRELRSYSLAAAIGGAMSGRLTGREAEIHAELSKGREQRSGAGIHLAVPTEILLGEARSQTVGTATAGGHLVATQVAAVADRFRPALRAEAMGATVLRNLTGFLDLPNLVSSGTASWVAENGNATRTAVAFDKVTMGPKTVAGEYRMSRRLMLQSSQSIEDILRRDLGYILAQALDRAAIKGGGSNEPDGILEVVTASATAETDLALIAADLMSELELDDVTGTRAFLTNPVVMKTARKTLDGEGHIIPMSEIFHGERVEHTTQVPTNLGVGTDKTALIYGMWSELVIGYWSGVDILVNPYHSDVASNGGALLHAFLDADVAVRHEEAFTWAEI